MKSKEEIAEMEKKNRSLYDAVEHLFSVVIPGIFILIMGVLVTAEILGRIFINFSIFGLIDITENLVALLAFLSLAGVQVGRNHITVDILPAKLTPYRSGVILDCVLLALSIVTIAFVFGEITWYMVRSYKTHMQTVTLFWPVWPFALGMAIGTFFMIPRMIKQFKKNLTRSIDLESKDEF
jgi:TRAP-type C4-dicarboxylate transport system permease small subunit